jgi:hypothetical protein
MIIPEGINRISILFMRIIIRRIKIMMELATVQVLEMMMNRHPEGVVEETEGTTISLSALSS